MSDIRKNLVAVYGTLRKGMSNHSYHLSNAELVGEFETEPIYDMYSVHDMYPALKENGGTSIKCEVYKVNDEELESIDSLEGYYKGGKHNLYDRKTITTPFGEAYIYVYSNTITNFQLVRSGDWKEYETSRSLEKDTK